MAFRAKTYVNRHEEKKLQVSGDQKEFALLVKGDADTEAQFKEIIAKALSGK